MTAAGHQTKYPRKWLGACGLVLLASCALATGVIGWMRHSPPKTSAALTAVDAAADMPVPTPHSAYRFKTTRAPGAEAPLSVGLEARVPAGLGDVLAFYRAEFERRGWPETPDGAVIAADHTRLTFVSPKGPAILTLGRTKDETTIDLVQRNTEAAARADILPLPGQARLIFGYLVPDAAALVINDQTIEIPGGVNHPQILDLAPGTYSYALLVWGRQVRTDTITLAAGEAWALKLGDGDKPDQLY